MTQDEMTSRELELRERVQLADRAKALIVTWENRIEAEELILALNEVERLVRTVTDPICDATNKAHKTSTAWRARWLEPILTAREHLRHGCAMVRKQLETVEIDSPKAEGITYRDNWSFEWIDKTGKVCSQPDLDVIPLAYHSVNEVAIRATVRTLKDKAVIPGIRVFNERKPVETRTAKTLRINGNGD